MGLSDLGIYGRITAPFVSEGLQEIIGVANQLLKLVSPKIIKIIGPQGEREITLTKEVIQFPSPLWLESECSTDTIVSIYTLKSEIGKLMNRSTREIKAILEDRDMEKVVLPIPHNCFRTEDMDGNESGLLISRSRPRPEAAQLVKEFIEELKKLYSQ